MTYRQLLDQIKTLDDEQLDSDVTIHDQHDDWYPATLLIVVPGSDESGVLDAGHPYLALAE